MGNKESAPPVEPGPRILWPGRKYKRNIKERHEKYLQTILPVPPPEYFLRGSLQQLCLHALATDLISYIWQQRPEGADPLWAERRLAHLTPEVKLMLWNHMSKWHFTKQHPPIPNVDREIIWTFDANKYYDEAKQQSTPKTPKPNPKPRNTKTFSKLIGFCFPFVVWIDMPRMYECTTPPFFFVLWRA